MKILKSKSGMTLVEIIVAILVLGIISISFASCFATAARILNRATLYKNASSTTSSTLELEEVQTSKDPNVSASFEYTDSSTITYSYKNGATEGNLSAVGLYGLSNDSGTGLTYKEFYPNNFDFEVEASDIETND